MVNREDQLDRVFGALSDRTRRAMLARLADGESTVSELAGPFDMSMPAITKHLNVLENAGLVSRRRDGRKKVCTATPEGAAAAREWMEVQARFWTSSFDRLDTLLSEEESRHDG